jgi:hypothetical protein
MYLRHAFNAPVRTLSPLVQISAKFKREASFLKKQVMRQLWDDEGKFFKVLRFYGSKAKAKAEARGANSTMVEVRELHGYTPW